MRTQADIDFLNNTNSLKTIAKEDAVKEITDVFSLTESYKYQFRVWDDDIYVNLTGDPVPYFAIAMLISMGYALKIHRIKPNREEPNPDWILIIKYAKFTVNPQSNILNDLSIIKQQQRAYIQTKEELQYIRNHPFRNVINHLAKKLRLYRPVTKVAYAITTTCVVGLGAYHLAINLLP